MQQGVLGESCQKSWEHSSLHCHERAIHSVVMCCRRRKASSQSRTSSFPGQAVPIQIRKVGRKPEANALRYIVYTHGRSTGILQAQTIHE